jgi:hypothetical protein
MGGNGGFGNAHFKSRPTARRATPIPGQAGRGALGSGSASSYCRRRPRRTAQRRQSTFLAR